MSMDTYSSNDKTARCAKCARFMPWSRSRLIQKSDGMPSPSPILIERGICANCESGLIPEARL